MSISLKVTSLKEPLDIDLQLMASELDTSVKNMKYLSNEIMDDALLSESFNKLCANIEVSENEVTSFNDNTTLYEYLDESVVVHNVLGLKYVIFDSMITNKIESKLNSYK